jgi:hypothetical protein
VRGGEALGDLARDLDGLVGVHRAAAKAVRERLALEELGDRVGHGPVGARVVDRQDRRVVQRRDGSRLALEAAEAVLVVGGRVEEELQRDFAPQAVVAGAIHLAHPALAEGRQDLVRPELLAGGERHFSRISGSGLSLVNLLLTRLRERPDPMSALD